MDAPPNPVKLGILYHQFLRRGGLEGYLLKFCGELAAAGHSLHLAGVHCDDNFRHLASSVQLFPAALTKNSTLRRFASQSAAFVPSWDVDAVLGFGRTYHQHVHRAGGGCHARFSSDLPWWKRWRPKNQTEIALERQLYTSGLTQRFVVNASKVASELHSFYKVPHDSIRVIHTAVDTTFWHPPENRAAARAALNLPASGPLLLFVSLDHRRKGLAVLLKALASLPRKDVTLAVAGKPLAPWRSRIAAAGLSHRIIEAGNVADLRPWYAAADLFVHPSHYDACANTVLQSMASALPGIISADDGASEFIQHTTNGWRLENSHSSTDLANLIESALASDLPAIGHAARSAMLPLTWQAHLHSWLQWIPTSRL